MVVSSGLVLGTALLCLGLAPFAAIQSSTMVRSSGLPSLKTFASLTAKTFEGKDVTATSMSSPNGAVIMVIRRMG